MPALTDNVDLSTMTECDVVHVHRLREAARPGDTTACPDGHQLVCDAGRVWTRVERTPAERG